MKINSLLICILTLTPIITATSLVSGCTKGGVYAGRGSVHYGGGYRGYYGRSWNRPPIYIGGGGGDVDPDWGVDGPDVPEAMPLPEMGQPDFGGDFGGDMDMGGFDW